MKPHPSLPLTCALLLCFLHFTPAVSAKIEEWRDAQGNTFKAEAIQPLGPMAIFRTEQRWARVIPFLALPPEECVRFHEQTKDHPQPAERWENAKDDFGRDLYRFTMQLRIDRLDPAWLKGRPEPEFTVVIYGSANESKSWDSIDLILPLYQQLKDAHGDRVEAVFYGLNHKSGDQLLMAERKNMPWLIADFGQQAEMDTIRRFAPTSRAGVLVFSHTGVPFFAADISNMDRITTPVLELAALLDVARPENPKSWHGRAHYLRAIQPALHKNSRGDAILVGNPLQPTGLRQRDVYRVEATLTIDADGKVTAVDVKPDPANLPEPMRAPVATALQRSAVFVPAVQNGQFVESTYHYLLEVPR